MTQKGGKGREERGQEHIGRREEVTADGGSGRGEGQVYKTREHGKKK